MSLQTPQFCLTFRAQHAASTVVGLWDDVTAVLFALRHLNGLLDRPAYDQFRLVRHDGLAFDPETLDAMPLGRPHAPDAA